LCGCETTGDPSRGGLFWSQKKAQYRIQAYEEELEQTRAQERLRAQEREKMKNAVVRESQSNSALRDARKRLEGRLREAEQGLEALVKELRDVPSPGFRSEGRETTRRLTRELERLQGEFRAAVSNASLEESLLLKRMNALDAESQMLNREIELLQWELLSPPSRRE
jgi:hypothetical protein